ncbi:hypothetical protein BDY19DRAFT_869810, partial [Irpex rosettiformis]
PEDIRFKSVRWLSNRGLMYDLTTVEGARWLGSAENRTEFIKHYGGGYNTKVKPRTYQILIDFVPTSLDLTDDFATECIELENNLDNGSIVEASWMKPPEFRADGQRTALLSLQLLSPETANKLL